MTSYAVLCVSVCCLDDECVVEWEWMDGQKSSKNEANCPACFLEGSNVAKELLNLLILVHSNPNQITITNVAIWRDPSSRIALWMSIDRKAIQNLVDLRQGKPSDDPWNVSN